MISFFTDSMLLIALGEAAVWDIRYRRVPDRYAVLILLLAAARWREACRNAGTGCLLPFWAGGVLAFILFALPAVRGKGMGGADVKLAAGIGFFYGVSRSLSFFCGAFLLCLTYCLGRWLYFRRKGVSWQDGIPLVPFFFLMQVLFFVSDAIAAA